MTRILILAKREWTEHIRQRWMVLVMAVLLFIVVASALAVLLVLNAAASNASWSALLQRRLMTAGMETDSLTNLGAAAIRSFNFLLFSELGSMAAILAGHSVLHDRQCGTLPFLLLAPVRRIDLLLGKVIGAMAVPFVLYVAIGAPGALLISTLRVAAGEAHSLPFSGAWVVAFFLGSPLWAAFVAAVCVIISAATRDVRTAQQAVWFAVFVTTMPYGYAMGSLMSEGVVAQVAVLVVGVLATGTAVLFGSVIISGDLSR